jgi:hypothetical protein
VQNKKRRVIKVALAALALILAVVIFVVIPGSSGSQKGLQLRWTGKMSLNVEKHLSFVHGDPEPFEIRTRYNVGPLQLETHKRRRY